ncbi:hypothetical protein GCM10027052_17130 [Parafrigoribacterium mesophilum]|uniref:hypothetical protein n=1 Tax=Parafrigoribacterium mesophilum TaxID=433646 RepID=UPI0031FC5904
MNLGVFQAGLAASDAVDWVSAVLLWILEAAGIVFLAAATRFVLAKTRELAKHDSTKPGAVAGPSSTIAPNHKSASPVPPENPHAPPTPAYGNPRVRTPGT